MLDYSIDGGGGEDIKLISWHEFVFVGKLD